MALSASGLKDNIKIATEGQTVAATAMTALGQAISKYINDNAVVAFSWIAALPYTPFTTDTNTTPTGTIQGVAITLTPSMSTTQAGAFDILKTQIIAGFSIGTYTITGFSVSPGSLVSCPGLSSLTFNVSGYDRDVALLQLATNVISWVTSQVPTAPCAGADGSYVGSGTVTSIS